MRRTTFGLYALLCASIALLLGWGLDLSRSVAQETASAPYRAKVVIRSSRQLSDGSPQHALAVKNGDDHYRMIMLGTDALEKRQLALERYNSRAVQITYTSPDGTTLASYYWIVYLDQRPAVHSLPEHSTSGQAGLSIAYAFP